MNKIFFKFDVPFENQIFFQDTATPTMSGIVDLHQHVFSFMIIIFILVFFQILDLLIFFRLDSYFSILNKTFSNNINRFSLISKYKDIFLIYERDFLKRYKYNILKLISIDSNIKNNDEKELFNEFLVDEDDLDSFIISHLVIDNKNNEFNLINLNGFLFILSSIFLPSNFNESFLKFNKLLITFEKLGNFQTKNVSVEKEGVFSFDLLLSAFSWEKLIKSTFLYYTIDKNFLKKVKLIKDKNNAIFEKLFLKNAKIKGLLKTFDFSEHSTYVKSIFGDEQINENLNIEMMVFDSMFISTRRVFNLTKKNEINKLCFRHSSKMIIEKSNLVIFLRFVIKYGLFKTNFFKNYELYSLNKFVDFTAKTQVETVFNYSLLSEKINKLSRSSSVFINKNCLIQVQKKYNKLSFVNNILFLKILEIYLRRHIILSMIKTKIEKFTHNTYLETIWTMIPIIIVLSIAIPSFILMYALDAALDGSVTIKVIGHQWYWNYECEFPAEYIENTVISNFVNFIKNPLEKQGKAESLASLLFRSAYPLMKEIYVTLPDSIKFDSYMIYDANLKKGALRLLEVDKPLFVPYRLPIDIVITATDVLHAWAIPSLGVKVDAIPGRLNHIGVFIERKGVFFGQCSELCGVNHAFMPIKLVAVSFSDYINHCLKYQLE